MRASRCAVVAVLAALAGAAVPAAETAAIADGKALHAFFDSYYREPRPDLVGPAIAYLSSAGGLDDPKAAPPVVGFFAVVFSANPGRLPAWKEAVDRAAPKVREALLEALSFSSDPKQIVHVGPPSPAANDMCWGAFSASGDGAYVRAVIDRLRHMAERRDLALFMAAASAKFSLASQALRHPKVREEIENAIAKADLSIRAELRDTLAKDPETIQAEVSAIVKAQHAAGAW